MVSLSGLTTRHSRSTSTCQAATKGRDFETSHLILFGSPRRERSALVAIKTTSHGDSRTLLLEFYSNLLKS